jgi:hypothetical protein
MFSYFGSPKQEETQYSTYKVKLLYPTDLSVNALARSLTWSNSIPVASSNDTNFCNNKTNRELP